MLVLLLADTNGAAAIQYQAQLYAVLSNAIVLRGGKCLNCDSRFFGSDHKLPPLTQAHGSLRHQVGYAWSPCTWRRGVAASGARAICQSGLLRRLDNREHGLRVRNYSQDGTASRSWWGLAGPAAG